MRRIPLSQGRYALVDDADYHQLCIHKWRVQPERSTFYARRDIRINKRNYKVRMHRIILGLVYRDGKQTDHIDGDGLNNQRTNLRICSTAENQHNQRIRTVGSSQYKGVCWHKRDQRWRAQIKLEGTSKCLGSFDSEVEAALAYNWAAKEHYREYARLNEVAEKGDC